MHTKLQNVFNLILCNKERVGISYYDEIMYISIREHSHMTSDFWVGRYVKVHLMISDVGRWVGQRGSDVRSAIFEFLLF